MQEHIRPAIAVTAKRNSVFMACSFGKGGYGGENRHGPTGDDDSEKIMVSVSPESSLSHGWSSSFITIAHDDSKQMSVPAAAAANFFIPASLVTIVW
jgi:hypothetical protein